jgi:hypothetical protein
MAELAMTGGLTIAPRAGAAPATEVMAVPTLAARRAGGIGDG